jgi:hypothetical protein
MEQKSEQINLEYMVEFEDGFKPRVHVYGIDSEAGEIYEAYAIIGILVGAGYNTTKSSKGDLEVEHILAYTTMNGMLNTTSIVWEGRRKLPTHENWERESHEKNRKIGVNVIRVQNPSHMQPAIDRHEQLYTEQFRELAKIFGVLFRTFIREHPGYGHQVYAPANCEK